jgi:hypothetical protein
MTQQTLPLPVDRTLTPGNARQRGYALVCDVFPAFIRENRELMATLAAEGCVLGAGSAGNRDEALGLYQPLPLAAS